MKFDSILEEIGEFGPYQQIKYLLLCLPAIVGGFHGMIPVFITAIPDHRCRIPGYRDDTYATQDYNHTQEILTTIPSYIDNDTCKTEYSKCGIFNRSAAGEPTDEHECSDWVYDKSVFESTVMTEFHLVCGKETYKPLSQTIYMVGLLWGSLLFGALSDRFGRKRILLLSIFMNLAFGIASAFAPDIISFIILRMFVGASVMGEYMTAFVMGIEIVGPSKRMWTGNLMNMTWALGIFSVCGIAYGIRNWFTLEIIVSVPMAIFLSYWWLIPESPRWLMAKGRYAEAHDILKDIAQKNQTVLPDIKLEDTEKADQSVQVKPWQMFTSRVLFIRCLIIFWNWIVVTMVYYGLSLNSGNLAGDIYMNSFLSGVIEIPAYILCLFLWDRIGRKRVQVGSMVIGGLACISTVGPILAGISENCQDSSLQTVTLVLSLVGKFGASVAFATIYIYSAELFPTVLRNASMGMSSMMARIGGMISPFIADLAMFVPGNEGKMLPLLVFGVCSVTAGIVALWLPETLNQKLPDTIDEAKQFGRKEANKFRVSSKTSDKEDESKGNKFAYLNPAFKESDNKDL